MKPKTAPINTWLGRLGLALALCGLGSAAWAAGTAAGTFITNKATLNFSVSGVAQTGIESSENGNSVPGAGKGSNTQFVVDRKVDLLVEAVAPLNAFPVAPGRTDAPRIFKLTNLGNDTQDFSFAVNNNVSGNMSTAGTPKDAYTLTAKNAFTVNNCRWVVNTSLAAAQTAADQTAVTAGASATNYVDELPADGERWVTVYCDIPTGPVNGDTSIIGLTATALGGKTPNTQGAALAQTSGGNTNDVDTVFGDAVGRAPGDIARDAKHSALHAYIVNAAILTVKKISTPFCDPQNIVSDPKNIPGAIVKYTITVSNRADAEANAQLTSIVDALQEPQYMEFVGDDYTGITAQTTASPPTCTIASANAIPAGKSPINVTCSGGSPARSCAANPVGNATFASPTLTVNYMTPQPILPAVTSGTKADPGELRPGESVTIDFYVRIK